jgi:hypothetical protein
VSVGDDVHAATRLNWVFDVVTVPVSQSTRAQRLQSTEEVGRALAGRPGFGDEETAAAVIAALRSGRAASQEQIVGLAAHFGVTPRFFTAELDEVTADGSRILNSALQECGVEDYHICRIPGSVRIQCDQVRKALPALRAPDPTAEPDPDPVADDQTTTRRDDANDASGGPEGRNAVTGLGESGPMTAGRLRQLCWCLVLDLGLLPPLDPYEVVDLLGKHRGRRIKIKATYLGGTTSVGHVCSLRRVDKIFIEASAPWLQQATVIYHEAMHLIRAHLEAGESLRCGGSVLGEDTTDDASGALGGMYSDWREWEAETGARLYTKLTRMERQPNKLPRTADGPERGIAAAFGFVVEDES